MLRFGERGDLLKADLRPGEAPEPFCLATSINELTLTAGEELRDREGRTWFLRDDYQHRIPVDFRRKETPKALGGSESP